MSDFTQLGFVKQTDGENIGTWGDVLNDSLIDLLDDAIGGYVEVSVASGNVTLAFADGTADNNGRHAVIKFTGSPGTTRTVTFPNKQKTYYINNGSDGSVICTAGSGGATVTVLAGNKDIIYVDGSDEIHSVLTRTSIVLGTNTAGNILVADGNKFDSKAVGDLSAISTIASGDTLLAVDASGGGLKKVARSVLVAGLATSSALNNVSEDDTPQLGGNLDMNGNDIITTSNATIDLAPNGTGTVVVRGNTNSGAIVFNCESNSHGQTVIAQPHSAGVTNTMLLPAGASSTLVSLVSTDTLTNKTLTSPKINEDVAITSTATELNLLDGITAGTVSASLAVIADSDKDISGFRNITLSGELDAGSLDVSGDADIDGTLEADAITVNGTALATVIAGTTVTNATNSAHVLVTDNESTNEENLIAFVEGATSSTGNVGLEMDGNFAYNPSTGTVSSTIFKGNIDAVDGDFDGTLEADAITIAGTAIGSIFSPIAGGSGILTTGALDTGSITSGFGNIDNGASNITSGGLLKLDVDSDADDLTGDSATGRLTIGAGEDLNLYHGGTNSYIVNDTGDLIIDTAGDIKLDAAGNDFKFLASGTEVFNITNSSSDVIIKPVVDAKDLIFQQRDGTEVMRIEDGAYASFAAAAVNPEATLTDGATVSWNGLTSPVAKVTLGGNRTLAAASGVITGQFLSILFIQDGTGSRTITFNAAYEHTGDVAPVLTTTAAKGDLFVYRYNGSKFLEVGRNLNLTLS